MNRNTALGRPFMQDCFARASLLYVPIGDNGQIVTICRCSKVTASEVLEGGDSGRTPAVRRVAGHCVWFHLRTRSARSSLAVLRPPSKKL